MRRVSLWREDYLFWQFRHNPLKPAEMLLVERVGLVNVVPDHPCHVEGINEIHVFVGVMDNRLQDQI